MSETSMTALAAGEGAMPVDDVLHGAEAIAEFIGETARRTHYLLEKKRLPAYKVLGRWRMRRSTYLAFVAKLEAEAIQRAMEAA